MNGQNKAKSKDTGRLCENAACDYLVKKGYTIKEKNFTVKGGEIDIIAEDSEYIVFVEVKARSAGYDMRRFGRPSDAVNYTKKQHFKTAVREYLHRVGTRKKPRIDVIEILMHRQESSALSASEIIFEIKHYIAAF